MKASRGIFLLALLVFVPAESQAPRRFTVTVSPLWGILQFLDVTAELRPGPGWGIAVNMMKGSFDWGDNGFLQGEDHVRVVAAQARWYPFEEGFHFAGEISNWRTQSRYAGEEDRRSSENLAGGLIGYKAEADLGLTFDFQFGGAVNSQLSGVMPMVRANVGWSFF